MILWKKREISVGKLQIRKNRFYVIFLSLSLTQSCENYTNNNNYFEGISYIFHSYHWMKFRPVTTHSPIFIWICALWGTLKKTLFRHFSPSFVLQSQSDIVMNRLIYFLHILRALCVPSHCQVSHKCIKIRSVIIIRVCSLHSSNAKLETGFRRAGKVWLRRQLAAA